MSQETVLILLALVIVAGCTIIRDRDLVALPEESEIVNARKINYGIRVGSSKYRVTNSFNKCNGAWFADTVYHFPRQQRTRIHNMDDVIHRFINTYNKENETNFNALVDYKLTREWAGIFELRSWGYLCGTISGILLEIE